ncbi:protein TonB [Luteibacter rhizovicinus]|uniref:Protein TonB n=1 Tax=Luteibacter rhizovicinus TaxID=242606 RepID=A0A4R3YL14_9GAMM|nr:energy transducer TonB [Luteibacter rhizovicinus]TCV92842.1 protein TonB [Luteibacter rhizovicinus]
MSSLIPAALVRRALIATAVIAVVGAAAYFVLRGRDDSPNQTATGPGEVASAAAPAEGGSEVDILLGLARDAMKENRLIAPQGNNAYEYYLSVVQLQPENPVALDALRETLPFASTEVERQINQRELDEARREIALLRDFDPTNYTLVILGAKLDAQQRVVTAEDEAKAAAMRNVDASAARVARMPEAPMPTPPVQHAVAKTVPAAAPPHVAEPQAAAPVPVAHTETAPVLRREVPPFYPADARRQKRQGWVEVSFTIEPDGKVSQAAVADADPRNVFDLAALGAVKRWEFTPATRDGQPVRSTQRRRIQFQL